jgi:16S rRNA (adenine1518-N6/adenine1519-N6)-dimethyltransferase
VSVPKSARAVRALLAAHGLAPRRFRGQNFLVDPNMIKAILRDSGVGPDDAVLEIGTGSGILTDGLANRAAAVVTCDLDVKLQNITRGLRTWPEGVVFLAEDALEGKHALNPRMLAAWKAAGTNRKLIANLPYSVATPILANLLWSGFDFVSATVLVQKEAADRFVAPVGTAEYGPMTVALKLLAEARIIRTVPPQVFWPQPKVESALLQIEPRSADRALELVDAGLPVLLHKAFLHRRKMLRRLVSEERLAAAGIPLDARPEQVEPEAWPRLLTV